MATSLGISEQLQPQANVLGVGDQFVDEAPTTTIQQPEPEPEGEPEGEPEPEGELPEEFEATGTIPLGDDDGGQTSQIEGRKALSGKELKEIEKDLKKYVYEYGDGSRVEDARGMIEYLLTKGISNPEQIYEILIQNPKIQNLKQADKQQALEYIGRYASQEKAQFYADNLQYQEELKQDLQRGTASLEDWSQFYKNEDLYKFFREGDNEDKGIAFMFQTFYPDATDEQMRLALGYRVDGEKLRETPKWIRETFDTILGGEAAALGSEFNLEMYLKNTFENFMATGETPDITETFGNIFGFNTEGLTNYSLALGESIAGRPEIAQAYMMREFDRQFRKIAGINLGKFFKTFKNVPVPVAQTILMGIYTGKLTLRQAREGVEEFLADIPGGNEVLLGLDEMGYDLEDIEEQAGDELVDQIEED